jgi:hypothetical protein
MEAKFHKHFLFLNYFLNCTNTQKKALLQSLTYSEKHLLKEIALNILRRVIKVDKRTVKSLSKHKFFLRKLSSCKPSQISKANLSRNFKVIYSIIIIALSYYAKCKRKFSNIREEVGFGSNRRVAAFQKEFESSCSESTTENEDDNEEEENIPEQTSHSFSESGKFTSGISTSSNKCSTDSCSEREEEEEENKITKPVEQECESESWN